MVKKHGYFHGTYKIGLKEYDVRGTYTLIPGGYVGDEEDVELLACHYWATEIVDGFYNGTRDFGAYLRQVGGIWQIGKLMNQRFKPSESPFLNWLKDVILADNVEVLPDFTEQL